MITITKESTKQWIKRWFPEFDFTRPISNSHWEALKKTLRKKDTLEVIRAEQMVRRPTLEGIFEVGDTIVNQYDGRIDLVFGISSDNLLILEKRGEGFDPHDWKKI